MILSSLKIKNPIIVSVRKDGVGTKLELADKFKKLDTIGIDLVAMCVNDLIVQGAKPLFFLDYIAIDKIQLTKLKNTKRNFKKGAKTRNAVLLEERQQKCQEYIRRKNLTNSRICVGIVSKEKVLKKENVKTGDIILAVPSSGIHSNGYSLVRNILKK